MILQAKNSILPLGVLIFCWNCASEEFLGGWRFTFEVIIKDKDGLYGSKNVRSSYFLIAKISI